MLEEINMEKQKALKAIYATAAFIALFLFAHVYHLTAEWLEMNKLQSPVVFQRPWTDRYVSPVGKAKVTLIRPTVAPKVIVKPKMTPTPTPKKRALKIDLVRDVEAAEISSDPVKEYIVEKFGKDAPVMLKIAQCESGTQAHNWYNKWLGATRETAESEGYAVGVFMVYRKVHAHLSFDDMLDYRKNVDYAYGLFQANGTAPWASSEHCWGL